MGESEYRVEMQGICKSFGGVHALQDVQLKLKPGEIHALIGENGAGKSTLIRVLSGVYSRDAGTVKVNGKEVHFTGPKDGIEAGISVIYQEFALVQHLTVAENILLDEYRDKKVVNWKELRTKAKRCLDDLGFGMIDVNATVRDLSVAYQQVVEISKALIRNANVLVLDEPTAVMTNKEVEQLFRLVRQLRDRGVSVLYVSHRLEEIFELCDTITVMKDGRYVDTVSTASIDKTKLVSMMIGRDLSTFYPEREHHIGDVILEAKNIKAGVAVKDISFNVRAGEILGLSGLVGAGRTECIRAILGVDEMEAGEVTLNGKKVNFHSVREAQRSGIGFLPEDRKHQGVLLRRPIYQNITLSAQKRITTWGWVQKKKEDPIVRRYVKDLSIKLGTVKDNVESLSGGNQQKVAIAKMLAGEPKVLFMDEPTRGVDVGAKIEIFTIVNELVGKGYAVVMISSEMTEIIGMCDRAVIIKDGYSVGELPREELTEMNLIRYAMGVQNT